MGPLDVKALSKRCDVCGWLITSHASDGHNVYCPVPVEVDDES